MPPAGDHCCGAGQVLVDDVRQTAAAFDEAATDMPAGAWQRVVRYTAGQEPCADVIVPSRLAEVLIHHVDLDIGFKPAHWPPRFAGDLLSLLVSGLKQREDMPAVTIAGLDSGRTFTIGPAGPGGMTVSGPEAELLAWLLGRSDGRSLDREPDGALPLVPAIY